MGIKWNGQRRYGTKDGPFQGYYYIFFKEQIKEALF